VILENLPCYPGRVSAAADGGLLICISTLRTHLLELITEEQKYLPAMFAEIDPEHWIQPRPSPAACSAGGTQGRRRREHRHDQTLGATSVLRSAGGHRCHSPPGA
jgi:hypothetical protein